MMKYIDIFKTWGAITLVLCMTLGASAGEAQPPTIVEESLESYNERMQWFAEAQYGMFIHFGLY